MMPNQLYAEGRPVRVLRSPTFFCEGCRCRFLVSLEEMSAHVATYHPSLMSMDSLRSLVCTKCSVRFKSLRLICFHIFTVHDSPPGLTFLKSLSLIAFYTSDGNIEANTTFRSIRNGLLEGLALRANIGYGSIGILKVKKGSIGDRTYASLVHKSVTEKTTLESSDAGSHIRVVEGGTSVSLHATSMDDEDTTSADEQPELDDEDTTSADEQPELDDEDKTSADEQPELDDEDKTSADKNSRVGDEKKGVIYYSNTDEQKRTAVTFNSSLAGDQPNPEMTTVMVLATKAFFCDVCKFNVLLTRTEISGHMDLPKHSELNILFAGVEQHPYFCKFCVLLDLPEFSTNLMADMVIHIYNHDYAVRHYSFPAILSLVITPKVVDCNRMCDPLRVRRDRRAYSKMRAKETPAETLEDTVPKHLAHNFDLSCHPGVIVDIEVIRGDHDYTCHTDKCISKMSFLNLPQTECIRERLEFSKMAIISPANTTKTIEAMVHEDVPNIEAQIVVDYALTQKCQTSGEGNPVAKTRISSESVSANSNPNENSRKPGMCAGTAEVVGDYVILTARLEAVDDSFFEEGCTISPMRAHASKSHMGNSLTTTNIWKAERGPCPPYTTHPVSMSCRALRSKATLTPKCDLLKRQLTLKLNVELDRFPKKIRKCLVRERNGGISLIEEIEGLDAFSVVRLIG